MNRYYARYNDDGNVIGIVDTNAVKGKPRLDNNMLAITDEERRQLLTDVYQYRVQNEKLVFIGESGIPAWTQEATVLQHRLDATQQIQNLVYDGYTYVADHEFQLNLYLGYVSVKERFKDKVKLWRHQNGSWQFYAHNLQELISLCSILSGVREEVSTELWEKLDKQDTAQ